MDDSLKLLSIKLRSVAVFRNLLEDDVVKALLKFLDTADGATTGAKINAYGNFVSKLYNVTDNLSHYILNIVTDDENVFIKKVANSEIISDELNDCVKAELDIFGEVASLTSSMLRSEIYYDSFLPSWKTSKIDFETEYFKRRDEIGKFGYGIYAKYHAFCLKDGEITPVKHPDVVTLNDLSGYHDEKQIIIDNTKALLAGKPAANILLSGDAGTGKSSTVKAVVNEFKSEGLRIVEIRKDQLKDLPSVIDELDNNPLKFIIFIDDLSFNQTDDNFTSLKAILEGTVSARSSNVVIYATSNRRHIVRESFSDRDNGDDVHRNDTLQELISLSERFGICVTFVKPTKECFLDIVKNIAEQSGIKTDEKLLSEAERFALIKGGRSARVARQFIDGILSKQ